MDQKKKEKEHMHAGMSPFKAQTYLCEHKQVKANQSTCFLTVIFLCEGQSLIT